MKRKEPHFRAVERAVYLHKLPDELDGLRLVHLGDLHEFTSDVAPLAKRIIDSKPDLVLATGDVLDRPRRSGSLFIALLKALDRQYPVYACLGNHELDVKNRAPEVFRDFMEQTRALGVIWLDNQVTEVTVRGKPLTIAGMTTAKRQPLKLTDDIKKGLPEQGKPAILLCHDPRWFDLLAPERNLLVLAGHVHGGLIRLPLLGGLLSPDHVFLPRYDRGYFAHQTARMQVTGGFGDSVLRVRLFNPRELTLLTLRPQNHEPAGLRWRAARQKPWVYLLMIVTLLALALNLLHSTYANNDIGTAALFGLETLLLLRLGCPRLFFRLRTGKLRPLYRLCKLGLTCFVCVFVFFTGLMITADFTPPPTDATVVVLGCRLYGETPSLMLNGRLKAARDYLEAHPDASCVVSGGQGPGETISEADGMSRRLLEWGISPERIYLEDQSDSTNSNIANSLEVIAQNGLSDRIVIVTDDFHQFRAQTIARRQGATCGAAISHTPIWLLPGYWMREIFGVGRLLILGY